MSYQDDKYSEWLKNGDFLLLKMAYDKAIQNGDKEFKIHVSGFEGSPDASNHIQEFASKNGLYVIRDGAYFIFRTF